MVDSVLVEAGDGDDAENVDAMLGHPNLADTVHRDEEFVVTATDVASETFDMSAGKAFIGLSSVTTTDNETRRQAMVTVEKDSVSGISIDDVDAVNYVWLQAQIGVGDSPRWVVNTGGAPSDDSLLVAKITAEDPDSDGSAEHISVTSYHNRGSDLYAESLSGDNDTVSLSETSFENAGHDEVDVPQNYDLVTDNFERSFLGSEYVRDTGDASVQSAVVINGSHSLEISRSSTGSSSIGSDGLPVLPQFGDEFSYQVYLTDGDDFNAVYMTVEDPSTSIFATKGFGPEVRADNDQLRLFEDDGSNTNVVDTSTADVSSHLNEALSVTVTLGSDRTVDVTLEDSGGNVLATVSGTVSSKHNESGGLIYRALNNTVATTQYFDSFTVTRRTTEETKERQRGSREISKSVSRGGVGAGPRILTEDRASAVAIDQGVTSNPSQGTEVGYGLQLNGEKGLELRAEADGSGGIQNPVVDLSKIGADLRLATGQAIEDGSGNSRLRVKSDITQFDYPNTRTAVRAHSGNELRIVGYANEPVNIHDAQGNFTAVQYDTSAAAGDLILKNAGQIVQGLGDGGKEGVTTRWDGSAGFIQSFDGTNFAELDFRASLYDFSENAADLRLATGQSIEDGSGTGRVEFLTSNTNIFDDAGNPVYSARSGAYVRIFARSGQPAVIRDANGGFNAVTYNASSPAPGTLELSKAELAVNAGGPDGDGFIGFNSLTGDGSTAVYRDSNGEVVSRDDQGNETTLT